MKTVCDIKRFKSQIASAMMLYRTKKISTLEDLIKRITTNIEEFRGENNSFNVEEVADLIYNAAERAGVVDQRSDFFNLDALSNLLEGVSMGVNFNNVEVSTEQLTNTEQVKLRLEASRKFLDNAYGLAVEVKNYVINQTNQNIFDCCFINRGSIPGIKKGIVKNTSELNNNIRHYQQLLVDRIVQYFNYIVNSAPNLKKNLSSKIMEVLQNPILYVQTGDRLENTGILKTLQGLIDSYLTPEHFKPTILTELYNISNDSAKSPSERQIAKQRLDAYNAYTILKHFDSYLSIALGKAIQIKDFNNNTGADKYQISDSTAELSRTWRTSDNIDVEKEADAITKLAIATTPLYLWQQEDSPVNGQYLQFQDFEHIIAKIKDLNFREDVRRVIFDKQFETQYKDLWNSLTQPTRDFLSGKTLSDAINYIRKNPRQYLPHIFEILTNKSFYDLNKTTFLSEKVFFEDELNKLYSIAKGVFLSTTESLYSLTSNDDIKIDYFSYITQVVDSIFNVQFLQYYRDQQGILRIRTFIDQSVNNLKRSLETTINTRNSITLINNFEEFANHLNLKPNSTDTFEFITFKLPIKDFNIEAKVVASHGQVYFKDLNGGIINFQTLWNNSEVLEYIDSILHLGVSTNIDFRQMLTAGNISAYDVCKQLLSFVARVHLNQYVSYNIINNFDLYEIPSKLEKIYTTNSPQYNYQLGELGLIHGLDIYALKRISQIKANLAGITSAIQVKDGEGNGQNLQTFSRLLGSMYSQWSLVENQENSATKDCILLNVPGLFEGVFTAKEYHNETGDNKNQTEMSVSEMAYSSIVLDFIGGLCNQEDNSIVGNGHVLFLPSVNSDKPTV